MRAPLTRLILTQSLAAGLWLGCGTNAFQATDKGDPAEDAVIALEKDDPDTAIERLESALSREPDNAKYLSLLAAAYAQRAGVEPIQFGREMSESGAGTSSASGLVAAFNILPEATAGVLSDIDKAIEILAELGSDNFLPGDTFKLGLYQAASFILHTKALDTNRDGTISASEAIDLSDTSAAGLLNQIAAAQAMLEAQGVSDPAAAKAAESIKAYQDQIDAQAGANQEEKLRNFLSAKGGATSTLTSTSTSTGTTLQLDEQEEEEREE
jgi:hypothetical protein